MLHTGAKVLKKIYGAFMTESITRIDELITAADSVKQSDFHHCLKLGREAYDLATEVGYLKGQADGLFYMGLADYSLMAYDDALRELKQSLLIYRTIKDHRGEANCLMRIGAIFNFKSIFTQALQNLQESLRIFESIGDTANRISALGNMANIYMAQDHLDLALNYYLEVLHGAEELGDKRLEASSLLSIGTVYTSLGEFDRALDSFLNSLEALQHVNNKRLKSFVLNNIGSIYIELQQPNEALTYLIRHQDIRKEIGLQDDPHCVLNIGRAYHLQRNYSQALTYFAQSDTLFQHQNDADGQGLAHALMGKTRFEMDDVDQAIKHYETAIKWVIDSEASKNILEGAHMFLAKAYQRKKNYQKAAEHFESAYDVFQHRQNDKIDKRVYQLKINFEVERKEKENELYRLKINQQKNELSNFIKNLANKNEMIQKLQQEILKLQRGDKSNRDDAFDILQRHLQNSANIHDEWPLFESEFDALFPDFRSNLISRFPTLTRQEIRICELIKLDFSTKDIARIFFIDPKSVEKHRNRVRKKMNLLPEINLTQFLAAF